jgi:ABC-type transporter Mla subunit MlaD
MNRKQSSLLALSTLILSACGAATTANSHLGALDTTSKKMLEELKSSREQLEVATRQSERIADALVALKDLGFDLVKMLQTTFAPKPAGQSDNIDDVLNSTTGETHE